MTPPRAALFLLRAACPERDFRYIQAELEVEFETCIVPQRGLPAARRWFWSQALRSAGGLAMMDARRGEWEFTLLFLLMATAGPAVLLEGWWSWVLSLIPLKADLARGEDFILFSLSVHAVLAVLAGLLCGTRGLLLAIPCAWVFSLLAQTASRSVTPHWFGGAALVATTLGLAVGAIARRLMEGWHGGRFA